MGILVVFILSDDFDLFSLVSYIKLLFAS